MSPGLVRNKRPRPFPVASAPAAFLVGLAVFGASVLVLGVLASEGGTTRLPASRVDAGDGMVILSHPVPPYAPVDAVLDVSYAFPDAPGDVYVIHCVDLQRLLDGEPLQAPAVRQEGVREGSFSRSMDGYLGFDTFYFQDGGAPPGTGAGTSQGPAGGGGGAACVGAFVAFRWAATGPDENRPTTTVQVREVPLDSGTAMSLFALAGLGGILALGGGIEWGRRRGTTSAPPEDDGTGTAETLYRLAERSEAWLARTRRYVLISGPLGVFLWYPVLIPWAWRAGTDGSGAAWMPWALSAGALLFLVGLTALWAREFLRLDRELAAWRTQVAELRRREERLMAELSG